MNRPLLNDDVLLHIMSFCGTTDRQTTCTLMQTSRLFHHAGAQYLLADGVSLHNEQIDSFVEFMFADGDYRLPLLRTLTLSTTTLPFSTGYHLTQLFRELATKGTLCSLKLHYADSVLRSNHELPYAIAMLPTLKSLCMHNVGALARKLLRHLRSELVYANLRLPYRTCTEDEDEDMVESEDEDANADTLVVQHHERVASGDDDLIALLHQSRQSLRELLVTCAHDYSQAETSVFPNLISLTLFVGQLGRPVTGHLARTFPNLQELDTYAFNPVQEPFDIGDFDIRRDRNEENQVEQGRWRALRYYEGTLEVLYSLAIACRIDWVKLKAGDGSAFEPYMLGEVLHDTRPVHLDLAVWNTSWLLDEEFLEIFAEPGARRLETLHIEVIADEGEEDLDVLQILNAVASRIAAPLRCLKEFRFTLECCFLPRGPDAMCATPTRLELMLPEVDLNGFAERLVHASAAASGSLASVCIKLPSCSTSLKRWRRGECGPPTQDFLAAYGDELNTTHMWDEVDEKAWSGVRRFL
ncbi:hypothetical protein TRAPUB_5067 [Trametes pubescens]|uniref:F-box domain-containing protein n=1 Tax=Trametes pubescens TaxID=154538 RepID=A0A1M2W774_TRAPU|nr:hypothetical protein TRAPUB_5067 [Trametes pubescens]